MGWNTRYDLRLIGPVPRHLFQPPPRVRSAMLKITRRKKVPVEPQKWTDYIAFVSFLLSSPGLRLQTALGQIFTHNQVQRIIADRNLNPQLPVKGLSVSNWVYCFNVMMELVPKRLQPSLPGKYKKLYRG
ncbi:MAG: hypothetical protein JJU37_03975 [Balneolaceae bacterium]|nr:hypothetical protein [Balneolaceae bacterium]